MIADSEQQVLDRSKGLALRNAVRDFIEDKRLNERKSGSSITFELSFTHNWQLQCKAGKNLEERMYNVITDYLSSELNLSLDEMDTIAQSKHTSSLIILSEI